MTDKPRSVIQHNRFFGLVKALYSHWPEKLEFQPDNEDHLRAYLLVKAKHRSIKEFHPESDGVSAEFARMIPIITALMLNRYCWAWSEGDTIKVCAPLTTNFKDMKHEDACKVYDAVDAYLNSIGIDPERLLKEQEQAA